MKKILNLTQHFATEEQLAEGVFELEGNHREEVINLLTFNELPTRKEVVNRARRIAEIAKELCNPHGDNDWENKAMIGGAIWLMPLLTKELKEVGILPVCAFSLRESVEETINGEVVKTSKFRHKGFIEV